MGVKPAHSVNEEGILTDIVSPETERLRVFQQGTKGDRKGPIHFKYVPEAEQDM
jgi:hypothetical protein